MQDHEEAIIWSCHLCLIVSCTPAAWGDEQGHGQVPLIQYDISVVGFFLICPGVQELLIALTMIFNPYILYYSHAAYLHQDHKRSNLAAGKQPGIFAEHV